MDFYIIKKVIYFIIEYSTGAKMIMFFRDKTAYVDKLRALCMYVPVIYVRRNAYLKQFKLILKSRKFKIGSRPLSVYKFNILQ